jgi:hypothetical protein
MSVTTIGSYESPIPQVKYDELRKTTSIIIFNLHMIEFFAFLSLFLFRLQLRDNTWYNDDSKTNIQKHTKSDKARNHQLFPSIKCRGRKPCKVSHLSQVINIVELDVLLTNLLFK